MAIASSPLTRSTHSAHDNAQGDRGTDTTGVLGDFEPRAYSLSLVSEAEGRPAGIKVGAETGARAVLGGE